MKINYELSLIKYGLMFGFLIERKNYVFFFGPLCIIITITE